MAVSVDVSTPSDARSTRSDPPARRSGLWPRLRALVTVVVGLRMLAVPIHPVITSDSVGYVGWSQELTRNGLIAQGYRQVAFPAWIRVSSWFGEIFDWDRLFSVVVLQRGLLAAAALAVWRVHGVYAIPVLTLMTAEVFVAASTLLVTEGVSVGLMGVFATLLTVLMVRSPDAATPLTPRRRVLMIVMLFVTYLALCTLKLQFSVLGLPMAAVMLDRRTVPWAFPRRFIPLAVAATLVLSLGVAQAVENQREIGVFEPVSERARASYYGAWTSIFRIESGNDTDPALAEYWADGDLYAFLHGLEATEPDYRVRRDVIEARIDGLFAAAGTTASAQRRDAFLGALVGGRHDDVAHLLRLSADATPDTAEATLIPNILGRDGGADAIREQLNDGEPVMGVWAVPLRATFDFLPSDHHGWIAMYALAMMAVLGAAVLLRTRHWWVAAAVLVAHVVIAAALSTSYIDNARYQLPSMLLIGIVAASVGPGIRARVAEFAAAMRQADTEQG